MRSNSNSLYRKQKWTATSQIIVPSFHYLMLHFLKQHVDNFTSPHRFFFPLSSYHFPILHTHTKFFWLLLCIQENFQSKANPRWNGWIWHKRENYYCKIFPVPSQLSDSHKLTKCLLMSNVHTSQCLRLTIFGVEKYFYNTVIFSDTWVQYFNIRIIQLNKLLQYHFMTYCS